MIKKKFTPESAATQSSAPAAKEVNLKQFLHEIEIRAYEIYLERAKHGKPGNEMTDWLAAETEIKRKYMS